MTDDRSATDTYRCHDGETAVATLLLTETVYNNQVASVLEVAR